MWNANPLQAERLSFILIVSSTQRGQFMLFRTPNPRCGDVKSQPPAGREIVFYTLWLEYREIFVHTYKGGSSYYS